jgi:5-methylcytosine-specific restriction protein A
MEGKAVLATIRDHITPLSEGGEDTESNVQPICADCHRKKTAEESKRGAARAKELR